MNTNMIITIVYSILILVSFIANVIMYFTGKSKDLNVEQWIKAIEKINTKTLNNTLSGEDKLEMVSKVSGYSKEHIQRVFNKMHKE